MITGIKSGLVFRPHQPYHLTLPFKMCGIQMKSGFGCVVVTNCIKIPLYVFCLKMARKILISKSLFQILQFRLKPDRAQTEAPSRAFEHGQQQHSPTPRSGGQKAWAEKESQCGQSEQDFCSRLSRQRSPTRRSKILGIKVNSRTNKIQCNYMAIG